MLDFVVLPVDFEFLRFDVGFLDVYFDVFVLLTSIFLPVDFEFMMLDFWM